MTDGIYKSSFEFDAQAPKKLLSTSFFLDKPLAQVINCDSKVNNCSVGKDDNDTSQVPILP